MRYKARRVVNYAGKTYYGKWVEVTLSEIREQGEYDCAEFKKLGSLLIWTADGGYVVFGRKACANLAQAVQVEEMEESAIREKVEELERLARSMS